MYHVIWDQESGGVLLRDNLSSTDEGIVPPRPVFSEELDLLRFDRFWSYPNSESPLLWASDRRYFYRGAFVAEARGGNIFEAPEVILTDAGRQLALEPVNVALMLERNRDALSVLENEAMDFIEETYKKYRLKKSLHVVVSFSGGKDSQVVLDLVSRIIPPDQYIVIFTDTTMEIPPTYQVVEETQRAYAERYPELQFYTARNPQHSLDLWRKFGPPSRILRWCCTVYKTAPVVKLVRELYQDRHIPKILIFDGVRAEESSAREDYKRIGHAVKHLSQINAEVIRYWNTTEVFQYLFWRNIPIHQGYRYGLERVGCSVCPFGSNWSEFIIRSIYPDIAIDYLNIIEEHVKLLGIEDENKIREYIIQRQWKKRAGGEGVDIKQTRIDFIQDEQKLKAILSSNNENFLEWLKAAGDLIVKKEEDNWTGQIKVGDDSVEFKIKNKPDLDKVEVTIKNLFNKPSLVSQFKKVLFKTTYCVHCGACEVECPVKALRVFPKVQIDTTTCIHCGNCLNIIERGCFRAKSLAIADGRIKKMKTPLSGFGRYLTFGMRESWVKAFFSELENWYSTNTLGSKQVDSFENWMKDAEILIKSDKKEIKITEFGRILKDIFLKDELLAWEIIWINLYYNSSVINWYVSEIEWGYQYSSKELVELITNKYPDFSEKTALSGIKSLMNMFDNNSFFNNKLRLGIITKEKGVRYLKKVGIEDIHPLAIAYYLYKYALRIGRYSLTVSELYAQEKSISLYALFGINRDKFEKNLRWLQENKSNLVRVDLVAGLDNIHLQESIINLEQVLTTY